MSSMFHFDVDYLHPTKEPQHNLPSLALPKWEMTSFFSWTSLFNSPTPRTLCLSNPTIANLNQVKSLCETEFGATKTISIYDPSVHPGITFLLKLKATIPIPAEDRGKGIRLVTLKKRIHVVNYVVNYGADKFTCLLTLFTKATPQCC